MSIYDNQPTATRKILKRAEQQGFRVTKGQKHLKIFSPDGQMILVIALQPRQKDHDMRAINSKLTKAGLH